jgi:hypothetical protein
VEAAAAPNRNARADQSAVCGNQLRGDVIVSHGIALDSDQIVCAVEGRA